jgi:hypothetical protein
MKVEIFAVLLYYLTLIYAWEMLFFDRDEASKILVKISIR